MSQELVTGLQKHVHARATYLLGLPTANRGFPLFNFCLVEDVTDQFWEFVSTPPRVPLAVANDWAWLRDGASAEIAFLPEGIYEIGLFSNGEQNLQQYPLLSSTEFIIDCSQA